MKKWKRCLAAMLAASMSFAMLPTSAAVAAGMDGEAEEAPLGQKEALMEPLASFDFNQEAENGKFVAEGAEAFVVGSVSLQERDAANGKALYLDGSKSYLEVKKADGGSLLAGLNEVTVSFDARPDRTQTNWGFYAAPNANEQAYGKEHYIGALINGGKTSMERYHNNGSRPKSASAPTGTDWSHVDAVFTENATIIYVDGRKAAEEASNYALPDILGVSGIFQIGKANWGKEGEYYKGWIDNFKVYGKALDAQEIFDVPDDAWKQALMERQKAKVAPVVINAATATLPDYDGTVTWEEVASDAGIKGVKVAQDGLTVEMI